MKKETRTWHFAKSRLRHDDTTLTGTPDLVGSGCRRGQHRAGFLRAAQLAVVRPGLQRQRGRLVPVISLGSWAFTAAVALLVAGWIAGALAAVPWPG
jgi:hypothetical protein